MSSLEEKLRSLRASMQQLQLHCSQQKQSISELQAKSSHQSVETDGLRRRIEELQQVGVCGTPTPDQVEPIERLSVCKHSLTLLKDLTVFKCSLVAMVTHIFLTVLTLAIMLSAYFSCLSLRDKISSATILILVTH